MLQEKLMATVIEHLMNEIAHAVDNGFSQEILGGDIWINNTDNSHAINLDIDWLEEPIKLKAVAFPLVKDKDGYLTEDKTAQEIIVY
tara:strand:+ start:2964 stop:3224 length:261 start_codon:yes stop_codon:yes gene_type:complete